MTMIAYGPVPSRRLGRSLGINDIPPKVCTYSCVYCQLGRTIKMAAERRRFYNPAEVAKSVRVKVKAARDSGEAIDYLTFVPDGEPTLDVNLGREIASLRPLGIDIAVISNSSLVSREEVREALNEANWVSLKMDAVDEGVWRKVNRPHRSLQLEDILDGALAFSRDFSGQLTTETMLVEGLNDGDDRLRQAADFVAQLDPATAYLAIPTRPPAEPWVRPPDEEAVNRAYQIFSDRIENVEYLIGYEGNSFALTGDTREDLLSIAAVHPMRRDAVGESLARAGAGWDVVSGLVEQGRLVETEYDDHQFFVRRIRRARGR